MQNIITQALKLGLWRPLDVQFAKMLTVSISSDNNKKNKIKEALILASASLSACVGCGHTCLPLYMLTPNKLFQGNHPILTQEIYKKLEITSIKNWQKILFSVSAVSDGSLLSPLVLENKCLYLRHMWQDEHIIAKFFNSEDNSIYFHTEKIFTILNQLFPIKSTNINWSKIAVAISLIKQKVLISGSPGTGKTFIIAKIITAFLLLYNKKLNIKMAAPTGKAATHLTESFNLTKHKIIQLNNQYKYIFSEKATTIHNLLGAQLYKKNNIYYDHVLKNSLDLDLLIIDEASMISLSIFAQLILALPVRTKVIFLGDHNQLYSVAPGSVFKDICQYANSRYSPEFCKKILKLTGYILPMSDKITSLTTQYKNYNNIIDNICILKKNYRFHENSGINQLSIAIKSGYSNRALSILTSSVYTDVNYLHYRNEKDYINMIVNCTKKYYRYLQKIQQNSSTKIIEILNIFNQYRILCAVNDGPFGATKINYYIEHILHRNGLIKLNKSQNYIGRPIIILRNTPDLGLVNGDTGILLLNTQEKLSAYFIYPNNTIKIIPIYKLPQYETCFAITIHKSQGSEFKEITIILPNQHIPILTRELLYTAVTRAKKNIMLYATNHVITCSINLFTQRHSRLYKKIRNIF